MPSDAQREGATFLWTCALFVAALLIRVLWAGIASIPVPLGLTCAYPILFVSCVLLSIYASRRLRWRAASLMLDGIALFVIGCLGMAYIAQACFYTGRSFALMDDSMAACDRLLGFDWLAYMHFFDQRAWLEPSLLFAYGSITWQPVVIIVCLAVLHDARRIYAFLAAQMVGLMIVCAVATFVPVLGAFYHYGVKPADHPHLTLDDPSRWTAVILWLRDAKFTTPVTADIGLVTFPSFHTVSAILYIWAAWRIPVVRWLAQGLNAAMLVATPLYGSHFLTDVVVGAVEAWVLVAIASRAYALNDATGGTHAAPRATATQTSRGLQSA